MEIFLPILFFAIGIVLIVKGGDFFVDAASWIAEASGVPKFIIGATIVSVATTLPELLVSIMASLEGSADMAVGNAVGSVTANVGLIMGISIFFMPGIAKRSDVLIKGLIMISACSLLLAFSLGGSFSYVGSIILLVVFGVFIAENIVSAKRESESEGGGEAVAKDKKTVIVNIAKFVFGTVGIVVGSRLLVDSATTLAEKMGVPEAVIGVTIVAVGTSLPELVTTVTAIVKKESSLSIGNIIGANILDLTLIMPLCSIITGGALPISDQGRYLDIPACLAVLMIAMLPMFIKQKRYKAQGILMLCAYAVYLVLMFVFFL